MGNKSTQTSLSHRDGHSFSIQQHETDSPILPVAQLEKLNEFKPDAVDWIISQTQIEAEHRRSEYRRINTFIFIEKTLGQIFAFLIGISGVIGGSYVAVHGQEKAGGIIATAALTGLAVVFLTGRLKKQN